MPDTVLSSLLPVSHPHFINEALMFGEGKMPKVTLHAGGH